MSNSVDRDDMAYFLAVSSWSTLFVKVSLYCFILSPTAPKMLSKIFFLNIQKKMEFGISHVDDWSFDFWGN